MFKRVKKSIELIKEVYLMVKDIQLQNERIYEKLAYMESELKLVEKRTYILTKENNKRSNTYSNRKEWK